MVGRPVTQPLTRRRSRLRPSNQRPSSFTCPRNFKWAMLVNTTAWWKPILSARQLPDDASHHRNWRLKRRVNLSVRTRQMAERPTSFAEQEFPAPLRLTKGDFIDVAKKDL